MFLRNYINNLLNKLIFGDNSPHQLALSFAVGIFIAFSPFIGFHNIMILLFSLIFKLNAPITFISAHINNPLTALPIFSCNYLFGCWFVNNWCNKIPNNPDWVDTINNYLTYYIGLPNLCFWSFMIGSMILSILFGVLSYPVMKFIFQKINYQNLNYQNLKILLFNRKNENYSSK